VLFCIVLIDTKSTKCYSVYIRYIHCNHNIIERGEILDIIISNSSDKPIYEQITMQIKNLIISGELKPGEALPSMRYLAKELRISVITTKRAYEDLERDGFITTVVGKGSFVGESNIEFIREEQLRVIEEYIQKAVEVAKANNIKLDELAEIMELVYKEV
jgi:GntR family transcriptional regulator